MIFEIEKRSFSQSKFRAGQLITRWFSSVNLKWTLTEFYPGARLEGYVMLEIDKSPRIMTFLDIFAIK